MKNFNFPAITVVLILVSHQVITSVIPETSQEIVEDLQGPNVCKRLENYNVTVEVTEMVPIAVTKVVWCAQVPPRCKKTEIKLVPTNRSEIIGKTRVVIECCEGFFKDSNGEGCVADNINRQTSSESTESSNFNTTETSSEAITKETTSSESSSSESSDGTEPNSAICLQGQLFNPATYMCECEPTLTGESCEKLSLIRSRGELEVTEYHEISTTTSSTTIATAEIVSGGVTLDKQFSRMLVVSAVLFVILSSRY